MLHFCVSFGIRLLCLVISSDNPIAMVEDLSEGSLYKFEVMCISISWANFIRMKLLATCYLVKFLEWWDQIDHKMLIILNQCFMLD